MKAEKKLNKKTGLFEYQKKDLPVNDRGPFKAVPKEKRVKVTPVITVPSRTRKMVTIKCGKHTLTFSKTIIN
jgi:hypothetical protein